MVDITEISAIVVALGVVVGVIYYILDMRQQTKLRQTDILSGFYSRITEREFLEALKRFFEFDAKDPVAFIEKHGSVDFFTIDNNMVLAMFDQVGVLLMRKLVDINLVDPFLRDHVYLLWEKAKPFVEDMRKTHPMPNQGIGLEYLYNEMKKREQKLQ